MRLSWAKCHRRVEQARGTRNVFLTFDDGPVAGCTDKVLELLQRHNAKASFFVIGQRAKSEVGLLERMEKQGHGIGDHSIDHDTRRYFTTPSGMRTWLEESSREISSLVHQPVIGFRAPAGVRTPLLHMECAQMQIPLVHWRRRFFDTARDWTWPRARRCLERLSGGDIILLHDSHSGRRLDVFLQTLEKFLMAGHEAGWKFMPLKREYFMDKPSQSSFFQEP